MIGESGRSRAVVVGLGSVVGAGSALYPLLAGMCVFPVLLGLAAASALEPLVLGLAFVLGTVNPTVWSRLGLPYLSLFEVIAVPWVCVAALRRRNRVGSRYEALVYAAAVAVLITRLASLVFAPARQPSQVVSTLRYVETLAVLYYGTNALRSAHARRAFWTTALAATLLESSLGILNVLMSAGRSRGLVLTNGIGAQQTLFAVTCLLTFVGESPTRRAGSLIALSYAAVLLGGVAASMTRGYWIMGLIALALAAVASGRPLRLFVAAVAALAMLGVCSAALTPGWSPLSVVRTRLASALGGGGTVGLRLALWNAAWRGFYGHPLTGIGSGGFARFQQHYYVAAADIGLDPSWQLSTHNTFLNVLCETGLLGLLSYLWFAVAGASGALRVIGERPAPQERAAAVTFLAIVSMDLYAQGSFTPVCSLLLAFLLAGLHSGGGNQWHRFRRS